MHDPYVLWYIATILKDPAIYRSAVISLPLLWRYIVKMDLLDNIKRGMVKNIVTKYDNGILYQEYTILPNGKKHGIYNEFTRTGIKHRECTMVNGIEHGPYYTFTCTGELYTEYTMINGKMEGEYKMWWSPNVIMTIGYYKDNKKVGKWLEWWYEMPQILMIEESFINDKLDGTRKNWYENGQIEVEQEYKNGEQVRIWRWWSQDGTLKCVKRFYNYNWIETIHWYGDFAEYELYNNGNIFQKFILKDGSCTREMFEKGWDYPSLNL